MSCGKDLVKIHPAIAQQSHRRKKHTLRLRLLRAVPSNEHVSSEFHTAAFLTDLFTAKLESLTGVVNATILVRIGFFHLAVEFL